MPKTTSKSMSRLEALVAEARRRLGADVSDLLDSMFPEQRTFIEDPSRFKVACCTRRAGKSFCMALYLCMVASSQPKANCLYLALGDRNAATIMLKDVFEEIEAKFHLGIDFTKSANLLTFPNGSIIRLAGGDSSGRKHSSFSGVEYDLVVIDEAQFWQTELNSLISKILEPTMSKHKGVICMIGVPDVIKNLYWSICTEQRHDDGTLRHPQWSIHEWSVQDNPHMVKEWNEALNAKLAIDPHFKDTAEYKMQYCGQWVEDTKAMCYKFDAIKNRIKELPGAVGDYTWILGGDVGWKPDPMAFVLMGYRRDHKDQTLYMVEAFKKIEMRPDEIKTYVDNLKKTYKISRYIIDGVNGHVVDDLQNRLGIPFEKVDKGGALRGQKFPWINLMSDDLVRGTVKLVGKGADELAKEWDSLVWDPRQPETPVELKSAANHLADAAMYGWKQAYHYVVKKQVKGKTLSSYPAFQSNDPEWGEKHQQMLVKRYEQNKSKPLWKKNEDDY